MAGNRSRPRFVVGAGCCGAVCAGGRRPDREIATREPSARSRRSRSPARPCRRPPAPRPGSAGHAGLAVPSMREPAARSHRARSPAKPSGPSGTLHTGGAIHCCAHPIQDPPPTGTHRHPPAPRPGSAGLAVPSMREPAAGSRRSRSPAKPSGPSGTLHTGGAFHCCAHPIQASPPTGTAAKPHSQASFVPQLTRCPPRRRCLVCWWVIGVVLKPGQVLPPPTGTAVGHQPGAVCPALVSNLARWGCSIRSWLAACRRRVAALMMSFPPF